MTSISILIFKSSLGHTTEHLLLGVSIREDISRLEVAYFCIERGYGWQTVISVLLILTVQLANKFISKLIKGTFATLLHLELFLALNALL